MLNFRKLKKDFSSSILKEGKELFEKKSVLSAKIVDLTPTSCRICCCVQGNFDNRYECEIEIDREDSTIMDSDCDCTYKYDCSHLAAVVFYLEQKLDKLVVEYSRETDIDKRVTDVSEKETLRKTIEEAKTKEVERLNKKKKRELLEEYIGATEVLGKSPFFLPEEPVRQDSAELLMIFSFPDGKNIPGGEVGIQLALRLPNRSKPLNVPDIRRFLNAIKYHETLYIGNRRLNFSLESFNRQSGAALEILIGNITFPASGNAPSLRSAFIKTEILGIILAKTHAIVSGEESVTIGDPEGRERPELTGLFVDSLENPLRYSNFSALFRMELEYLKMPSPKILINPTIVIEDKIITVLEEARLFECALPGMMYANVYYRFSPQIRPRHLRNLFSLRSVTIPEPLFGTFVENALPELMRFAEVTSLELIERFVTLPFTNQLKAECDIYFLNGELEASINFIYDKIKVPAAFSRLKIVDIEAFITKQGILARDLAREQLIIEKLFQDFIYDHKQGVFRIKSEKKIVEFMTEVIPENRDTVKFNCPENLLDLFVFDDTSFKLSLKESDRVDLYVVELKTEGPLKGVSVDHLWDCIAARRPYIELRVRKEKKRKILVIDPEKISPVVQIFDELGIGHLDNHKELRPLWTLAGIDKERFRGLPVKFSMSPKLEDIRKQMLGLKPYFVSEIPKGINASLRKYQKEGVYWLDRLRNMHLNGILADDMGLGKTLQAIIILTRLKENNPGALSLVVCPTSLVYNWQEEFHKFNDRLKVLPIDGTPAQRKKLLKNVGSCDVLITSYSLLQKDVEEYKKIVFDYVILDEAQFIKNRSTRNARSVKMINSRHRLILTGTPIENSLEELWSLFDFLMPGLLSAYDRFVDKYVRSSAGDKSQDNLARLRNKLSPFILRRMKKDVIKELPAVSEIVYHCQLSKTQEELYRSYASSALKELTQLVKKEGFEKIQIHVLATLTRLKQICCHPAIFAKEKAEAGDSAKYDMLMELLNSLIEGGHKTVIFSQYAKMLQIMRKDLSTQGVRFEYLDGSTKNRLKIVNRFNEEKNISVFLVSLKAGGTGLNLIGADTVIHYDMWWNPAVESQATDRVHRIGQKNSVSSYKLVTLGTIEEKIVELQNRKKNLVKKVINVDEEAISKLTWEEVLELLQT